MKHHQNFKFYIKSVGDEGSFTGLGAVYGNVDQGGDVILPGAFKKTLKERDGEVPLLWQHDTKEPIGLATLTDTKEGLRVEGELVMESPVAQKAYALLKKGVLKGLSIGYDTISDKVEGGVRYLKELKLWEMSLVTFPMNELALVSDVKSASDFLELLKAVEDGSIPFSGEELSAALKSLSALAAKNAPAATLDVSAPDLHAVMTSLTKEIQSWT